MTTKTLRESILKFSTISPDSPAIIHKQQKLNYAQLADLTREDNKENASLCGMRVLVLLPDSAQTTFAYIYLFTNGAVIIPASVLAGESRIEEIISAVSPHCILTNSSLAAKYHNILEKQELIIVEAGEHSLVSDCQTIRKDIRELANRKDIANTIVRSNIRFIVFTSGSTNKPKGVCLSEGNILSAARMNVNSLQLISARQSIVLVPTYDYYGLIQIYSHLLVGASIIVGESTLFLNSLCKRLEDGATDLVSVPFSLADLLRKLSEQTVSTFRKLKVVTSSSDILSGDLLGDIFKIHPSLLVYNIYGLTEAGRACFRRLTKDDYSSSHLGTPSDGVKIWLEPLSNEEHGEIIIAGPNVMIGYLRGIENGHLVIKEYQCMRTGDLGLLDPNGKIVLLGRKDHLINLRGVKIHPIEIERIALQVEQVMEAKASLTKSGQSEDEILLEIVCESSTNAPIDLLRKHLKANLNPIFFPANINCIDSLKRTELGSKLIRK